MKEEKRKAKQRQRDGIQKRLDQRDKNKLDKLTKKLSRKDLVKESLQKKREYDRRSVERKELQSRKDNSDPSRSSLQSNLGRDKGSDNPKVSKGRENGGSKNGNLLPEPRIDDAVSKSPKADKRVRTRTSKGKSKRKPLKKVSIKNIIK